MSSLYTRERFSLYVDTVSVALSLHVPAHLVGTSPHKCPLPRTPPATGLTLSCRPASLAAEVACAISATSRVIVTDATGAERVDKGLRVGALGLPSSTVVGVASTAPAYSLAATIGFVVVLIGARSPIVTLLAFVPMLLISFAYRELNRADPDCGTTFTWATRALSPLVGWMGGWGIVAADVLVMPSLAQVAGQYVFS